MRRIFVITVIINIGLFGKLHAEINNNLNVPKSQCGINSLYFCLKYFGYNTSFHKLYNDIATNSNNEVNLKQLADYARHRGLFANGPVEGNEHVGGLVGKNGSETLRPYRCYDGVITNSYWNIETSGEPYMCGYQEDCATGCDNSYGKTTAEMHQRSTFTDWDFINVWNIGENQIYPYLRTIPAADLNKDGIVNFLDADFFATENR